MIEVMAQYLFKDIIIKYTRLRILFIDIIQERTRK